MNLEIRAGIVRRQSALKNTIAEIKTHEKDVRGKILLSAVLGAGVTATAWGAIPVFAFKESEWIRSWFPVVLNTAGTFVGSYAVNLLSNLANLNQGRRLLLNPKIQMSHNFIATSLYHSTEVGEWKEKRKTRSAGAVFGPTIASLTISAVTKDPASIVAALLYPQVAEGIIVLKLTQGAFNLAQVIGAEVVLRTKGREKKKTQNLPANGVIFQQAEVKDKV